MPTVPNSFLTVQCMPPAPLDRTVPFVGVYTSSSPSWIPTVFSNGLPGPAAFENTGLNTSFRSYDRAGKFSSPGGVSTLYAWQGQHVFALTAPPNWSLQLTVSGMSGLVDFGLHTGLYLVDAANGSRAYICGLFRGSGANEIGWIKFDLTTGTWTQGKVAGMDVPGSTMSTCAPFKGSLAHAGSGKLTLFDPYRDKISQFDYGTGFGGSTEMAKVRVANERLFVVDIGGGLARVGEFAFGSVLLMATLPTLTAGAIEPFSPPLTANHVWVQYEQSAANPAGQGMRLWQYNIPSSVTAAPIPAPFDAVANVPPVIAPPFGIGQSAEMRFSADNGYTSTPNNVSSILGYLFNHGSQSTIFTKEDFWGADFGTPTTIVQPPVLNPITQVFPTRWSRIASPHGTAEHLAPGPFAQLESAAPYRDSTVNRGMLIKFRLHTGGGTHPRIRFLYGRNLNPVGGAFATLSVGDGIAIGGSLSLDAPDKSLFTMPVENGATLYQIIWDLGADGVPNDEWVTFRGVMFTPGQESAGLIAPGTTHTFLTRIPDPPPPPITTGGPVREVGALGGNPSVVGGPVREVGALGGNPSVVGGPVREVEALGEYPGSVRARVAGRAHSEAGGLDLQVDGASQGGTQPVLNFLPSPTLPSRPSGGQDGATAPDAIARLGHLLAGPGLPEAGILARVGSIDMASATPTDLLVVPVGFEAVIFGASLRAEVAVGVAVPAVAGIGTNGTHDNIRSSQPLSSLLATGATFEYLLGGASVVAVAGETVRLGVDTAITGTSQTAEVSLFGYLRAV